ncbi:M48 family metalloprotease [Streptomyces sp. NPDC013161]|uniref:M48 family metalloprotease n=1 Tax=Streptomyces sp. NPDC013161 TaxID=3364862 RepID=UPI003692EC6C
MTAVLGWLRGLFAVGMLAGFYVVAFTLLVVDTALVVLTLWAMVENPSQAGNWSLALGGSIPAASALLYGIATVSRTEAPPPDAVLLRRADAPGLWRLVEELAGQLRTRPPSRIYLTAQANASVSEDARLLGFAVGERTMSLGVPLLRWLQPMELRAVLCHELGHYAGRHTRFGAITYRGAASLRSTLFRLRMTARSDQGRVGYAWLYQAAIGAYAWMYLRLSLAVRRRQELEADAEAASIVGPEATAQALRAVHALGVTWAGFESRYLRPVQRLGFVPEDVFEAFAAMVDDPPVRTRMAELRAHPVESGRSPLDSHPPLVRRLALIEARPAGPPRTVAEEGPLIADTSPVTRVQRKMLGEAGHAATALPWTEWADLAAEAFAIELASLLLDAASDTRTTARPTLATVLGVLERGEHTELVRRLTDAPEPEEQLTEALYALTGQALAGAGRARWVLSWTQGYLLDCPRDPRGRLDDLVAAAARDRTAVPALRGEFARLGLDIEAPVVLALRTAAAPAGRTTARRSTRSAPDLITQELARQRTVAKVTMGALAVAMVVWGAALLGSDSSQPYPQTYRPGLGLSTTEASPYEPWSHSTYLQPEPSYAASLPAPFITRPLIPLPVADLLLGIHHVVSGDTLSGIACEYGTTVKDLQELNDMGKGTALAVGQTLLIPAQGQSSGSRAASCR